MTAARQARERVNQKRRTRAAVVAAAAELLRQGRVPTVAEAAERAAVSRATAYRYFPTQDLLLIEAGLEPMTIPGIERALAAMPLDDAPARVDALLEAHHDAVIANEATYRVMLRLSLEQGQGQDGTPGEVLTRPVRRGGRRIRWLEDALRPLRSRLDEARWHRLVASLSLLTGIEAVVVLRDVCGLTPDEALAVTRWSAQALIRHSLAEER